MQKRERERKHPERQFRVSLGPERSFFTAIEPCTHFESFASFLESDDRDVGQPDEVNPTVQSDVTGANQLKLVYSLDLRSWLFPGETAEGVTKARMHSMRSAKVPYE